MTTAAGSATGTTTATVGGNVTADGGATVTNRGVCYKTSSGVTISDNKTPTNGTTGAFTVDLSSLSVNQIYYYKAYAENSAGTTLGSELNFTTLAIVPAAPTVANPTASTLDITVNENSNPSSVEFAIQRTNDNYYLQSDGTFGASAFWATKSTWGTKTATGLSASTTYYIRVKARNSASVETAFGSEASGTTTSSGAPERWTALYNRGTPVFSYYLGDSLAYIYKFAINTDTTGWTIEYGLGKTTSGSGWTWRNAEYDGNDGNTVWKSKASEQQFTSTGSWYYAGRFTTGSYTYNAASDWVANTGQALDATNYFTVSGLTAPSSVTAVKDGDGNTATRADLSWSQWNSKNVLITIATATPTGSPVDGTAYSASQTFGNQTVVSGSQGGTALEVAGLVPGQTYYFTFYSENYSYYSAGATATALTLDMPKAQNTGGGSPEAPASIFLGDSGKTFGLDSWGTLEGNWGAAQLWLRSGDADLTGGVASDWSGFTDQNNKTRTSGTFTNTGTWYWGIRMDYGSPYGSNFWYKASNASWTDMASTGSGASLSVTVSAINDPASQTAVTNPAHPSSQIALSWAQNAQSHNVMVVRKPAAGSWTEPTQGTSYSAGNSIGAGTVVYNGSDLAVTNTGLAESSTYDFKFYSVNNNYYSAGVTSAPVTTAACAPAAPTGVLASETNQTDFTAAWDAVSGATGYRLDVSTNATFSVGGGELPPVSVLSAGDIAIVGANFDDPDQFSFVALVGIAAGTTIYFTDNGWTNDHFRTGEGIWLWSNSTAGAISAGTIVTLTNNYASVGTVTASGSWALSGSGDQITAYQTGVGTTTMIYAVNSYLTGWQASATSANSSGLPTGLTDGTTAVAIDEIDNFVYGMSVTSGTQSALLTAIGNKSNWSGSDTVRQTLPPAGSFTVSGGGSTPSYVTGYSNLAVAGTSQAVTGLTENTAYYFRVRAEGDGGCPSANSATGTVTTTTASGGPQTIDFPAIADQVTTNVVHLSATASSGLTVSFAVLSGPASIADLTNLTFTGAGEVKIVASQAGGSGWDPAPDVTNTFNVTKAVASVTLNDLAQAYDGTERVVTATTVPASLTVDITYDGNAWAPTNPGTYEVIGLVNDTMYQGGKTNNLVVSVANPASFSATAASVSAIDLAFAANGSGNDVVIVRNLTGTFDAPTGTPPAAGNAFAGGTVVYVGTSSPQTDSSLGTCTPYFYKAWSHIDGWYSTGLTDNETTATPAAPAGVLASLTNSTDFTAAWDASTGASGYRLDVSTEADFGGAGADLLNDGFEGWTNGWVNPPTGWENNGATFNGNLPANAHSGTNSIGMNSIGDWIRTPALTDPGTLSYWIRTSSDPGDWTVTVSTSPDGSAWTVRDTIVENGTGGTINNTHYQTNVVLNLTGSYYIRWDMTARTADSCYIDDVVVTSQATPSFVPGFEDLAVAGTSQSVTGLTAETTYYFRVRAEGAGGCTSANSATGTVTTLAAYVPEVSLASVNVREAGEGRFFVRLDRAPAADVSVAVARSAGDANVSVQSGASLTFTALNWTNWQAVTLAAADDVDTDNGTATIQVTVAGSTPVEVTATELDDDGIGENLALTAIGATISGGSSSSRAIDGIHTNSGNYASTKWTNEPPIAMTLDLMFTTTVSRVRLLNWDWSYRVHRYQIESSLNGVDWSPLVDASSGDHQGWENWTVASVSMRFLRFTGLSNSANDSVSIAEWEVYGVRDPEPTPPNAVISPEPINVLENGEGRFFVRLDWVPVGVATVTVSKTAGDSDITLTGGGTLTFTPANWRTWQPVTLAAASDGDTANGTATVQASNPDSTPATATATELDDDIGSNLALAAGGSTITGGKNAAKLIDGIHTDSANYGYTVWTSSPPTAMTLDLQSAVTVSRIRLLNWDWTYRVHRYQIESSVNGADWTLLADASAADRHGWDDWPVANESIRYLRFTGLSNSVNGAVSIAEWAVIGTPATLPAPVVSKSSVNVRENGQGRFFVKLAQAPLASTVVSVSRSAGDADITVNSGSSLTFTPANWSAWQTVTLAAADDGDTVGGTATINVSAPGATLAQVTATELDDDIGPNLALASAGSTIAGGKNAAKAIDGIHLDSANYGYTVWTNVPPGTMTLDLKATKVVSRVRLLNWDWSYRVHRYTIESSVNGVDWTVLADASATDRQGWDDWSVASVSLRYLRFTGLSNSLNSTVTIPEWEVYGSAATLPAPVASKANVNVKENGQGRFFVKLAQAPAASTIVTVSPSAGDADLTVSSGGSLTFTPANWSTWQAVTLAAADDGDTANGTATIDVSAPGATLLQVTATELDDDIGSNLALASAGSTVSGGKYGYKTIDGTHLDSANYGYTVWTNDPPGTMTLDLKVAATVSRVRLLNWDWSYRAHRYTIESSTDGATWTPLADASATDRQGWDDWAVADVSMRYLRFTGLSNTLNSTVTIAEWEVIGTAPGRRNLAAALADSASESEPISVLTSDGPEDATGWNAVDGDSTTAWVGQKAGGGYLVIEYRPALKLSVLEVELAEGSLAGMDARYSQDGVEWLPLPEDTETNPVSLNFLWLLFPDDGTAAQPNVLEILPNP